YKNVPETESASDRTTPEVKKSVAIAKQKTAVESVTPAPEHREVQETSPMVRDQAAERLFNDMVEKEHYAQQQLIDAEDEAELEPVLGEGQRLEGGTRRDVATAAVWRALDSVGNQDHNQGVDALLRAAEESDQHAPHQHFKAVVDEQPVAT